jgi:uncharacterized protein (DUF2141 family)
MRSLNSRKSGSKFRARQAESNIERLEGRTLLSSVVVNTIADSTDAAGSKTVSLRDAIAIANASTTPTTITFSPTVFNAPKTILLNGTQLRPTGTQAETIIGPAAGVTISGGGKTQVLVTSGRVEIENVSIVDGKSVNGDAGTGGGIFNVGNLTLINSTVSGNTALGDGGGIESSSGTPSNLTLINDTITGNTSGASNGNGGGGIRAQGGLTMVNCTVAGNTAVDSGGGLSWNGGPTTVSIANSIIAGNSATGKGPDVAGTITSAGFNLIGKTDDSTGWTSKDQTGTIAKPLSAKLGSLANNEGPTETLLPLAGSPAINKGSNTLIASGTTTDQRGLPRIYNSTVDIGAVEVQPLIQIKAPANQKATQGVSTSVTLGSFTQYTNDGPFKDTITWGDGSASTTLSLTAAGTIPATAHVFAKSGTLTVTETITDAKSNKSNTITFTDVVSAPPSSISGTVFDDANGDGKIDDGEFGVGLWTVYLDLNKDGKLDTGDKSVTTDINGKFSFTGLAAGTYVVRVVPVTGTVATKPTTNMLTITLTAGQNSTGNLFGEKAVA